MTMPLDRIEETYQALDQMAAMDGLPRPERFGGGNWSKEEELAVYYRQVGRRYTPLQWTVIFAYAKNEKGFDIEKVKKLIKTGVN